MRFYEESVRNVKSDLSVIIKCLICFELNLQYEHILFTMAIASNFVNRSETRRFRHKSELRMNFGFTSKFVKILIDQVRIIAFHGQNSIRKKNRFESQNFQISSW